MADGFAYEFPPGVDSEQAKTLVAGLSAQGKSEAQIGKRLGRLEGARAGADSGDGFTNWLARRVQQRNEVKEFFRAQAPVSQPLGEFDTKLPPDQEAVFQVWKRQYAPKDSGADYDLRGAFKAGLKPDPQTGHWPDTFKKPNHPTFSDESQYAKGRVAGHWQGERFIPPSEVIEPGVLGNTTPSVDPVDMLSGGATAALRGGAPAFARAALQTGASEAAATGGARAAGAAGLPPWMQQLVGLAVGLGFPGAIRGKATPRPVKATPEAPARTVYPEVVYPPPPSRIPYQPQRQIPYDVTPEIVEPTAPAVRPAPRAASSVRAQLPAPPKLLEAPRLALPPPRIEMPEPAFDPQGRPVSPFSRKEKPLPRRTKRTFETLDEPVISAKPTSQGIVPFERGRGQQPGSSIEPPEYKEIPSQPEQIRAIQDDLEATHRRIKEHGGTNPEIAMESYKQAKDAVESYHPQWNDRDSPEFKKWGSVREALQRLDSWFPTREQLLDASFSERLNRQIRHDRDAAQGLWRLRGEFRVGQSQYFGRGYGALQVNKGDVVKTKWGMGKIENNPPRLMRGKTGSGKPQGIAPNWLAHVRMSDGTLKKLNAHQFIRIKDEMSYPGQLVTTPEKPTE